MELSIEVTQEDINNGIQDNSCFCPIARAINRLLSFHLEDERVSVSAREIRVYTNEDCDCAYFIPPYDAERFIRGFDAGDEVKPFKFRLQ